MHAACISQRRGSHLQSTPLASDFTIAFGPRRHALNAIGMMAGSGWLTKIRQWALAVFAVPGCIGVHHMCIDMRSVTVT